jgi:hypothetical protein
MEELTSERHFRDPEGGLHGIEEILILRVNHSGKEWFLRVGYRNPIHGHLNFNGHKARDYQSNIPNIKELKATDVYATLTCARCEGEGGYEVLYDHPSRRDPFEQAEAHVSCESCHGAGQLEFPVSELEPVMGDGDDWFDSGEDTLSLLVRILTSCD